MRIGNSTLFLNATDNFNNNEVLPKNTPLNISNDKFLGASVSKSITSSMNTFALDIQNTNLQLSSIQTLNNKIDQNIESLLDTKELLIQFSKSNMKENESDLFDKIKHLAIEFELIPQKENLLQSYQTIDETLSYIYPDKQDLEDRMIQERVHASYFLNPNQKFYTESEQRAYQNRLESAKINPLYLEPNDRKIYFDNLGKSMDMSSKLDKRTEFDSVIDSVYNAKRILQDTKNIKELSSSIHSLGSSQIGANTNISGFSSQKSFSFTSDKTISNQNTSDNNSVKSIDEQIDILDEVHEKLLLASKDTSSISQKEELYDEIKELLKELDPELIQGLFEGMDEFASSTSYYDDLLSSNIAYATDTEEYLQYQSAFIVAGSEYSQLKSSDFVPLLNKQLDALLEKQKNELSELTDSSFEVSSYKEAKSYEEQLERREVEFNSLSGTEKHNFLANKYKVLEKLEFNEEDNGLMKFLAADKNDYNKLNKELNGRFLDVEKVKNEELTELLNGLNSIYHAKYGAGVSTHVEAKTYLEKLNRRELDIDDLTRGEQDRISYFKDVAQRLMLGDRGGNSDSSEVFKNNIDNLIENVDNMINILNKSKLDYASLKKDIQDSSVDFESLEKENNSLKINSNDISNFSRNSIHEKNGSFSLSQGQNTSQDRVSQLIA